MRIIPIILILLLIFSQNAYAANVVINEFLPNPSGSEDTEWIELFNPSGEAVDLTGWQLDDSEGGSSPFRFPEQTIIPGQGFITFEKTVTSIALNNSNDLVRLFDSTGAVIDTYEYSATEEGNSFGRTVDGGSEWGIFTTTTKGASNAAGIRLLSPTPFPTATLLPTKTPPPTKIPTPTKGQEPTVSVLPTNTGLLRKQTVSPVQKLVARRISPAVLGKRTQLASPSARPTKPIKVLGSSDNKAGLPLFLAGGFLIICCAILAYNTRRKSHDAIV